MYYVNSDFCWTNRDEHQLGLYDNIYDTKYEWKESTDNETVSQKDNIGEAESGGLPETT